MTAPISPEMLYLHLLDTEAWLASQKAQWRKKEQYHMLVNVVVHGGSNSNKQQNCGPGDNHDNQGNHSGPSHNNGGGGHLGNPNNPYKYHQCQVCGKFKHTFLRC
jgi:hypothetical protein